MSAPRGFKAVAILDELDDKQVVELVLSNWHKLNSALKHGQSVDTLRRLLCLELKRGSSARPNFAERIRSSLFRAMTTRASEALQDALTQLGSGAVTAKHEMQALIEALTMAGLTVEDADEIAEAAKESA